MGKLNLAPGGICAVCGCCEEESCPQGCFWVNDAHTLCSVCLGFTVHQANEKRANAMEVLADRLMRMHFEAIELFCRLNLLREEAKEPRETP